MKKVYQLDLVWVYFNYAAVYISSMGFFYLPPLASFFPSHIKLNGTTT